MSYRLTDEQEQVCRSEARRLLINAFAGTGKTSVLVEFARRRPEMRFLYLAFNRANRIEAEAVMPENVKCMTPHGLAFHPVGRLYQGKLDNPKPFHVAQALNVDARSSHLALEAVKVFMASADPVINEQHLARAGIPDVLHDAALPMAQAVWQIMTDRSDPRIPCGHDVYLKLYQSTFPVIRTDCVLFDEAQDASPLMIDIIERQACRKVVVGDERQAIYAWRRAVNAMKSFDCDEKHYLTASFRFGDGIAQLATALLADWGDETRPLRGLGSTPTRWRVDTGQPHTRLGRTNAGLFEQAVHLVESQTPFGYVGKPDSYKLSLILDAYWLKAGQHERIQDRFMRSQPSWTDFLDYSKAIDDREGQVLARIVEEYGHALPSLVERIRDAARTELQGDEVVLCTAHRSKGLEWPNVVLLDDFAPLQVRRDERTGKVELPDEQEVNLIYVAVTRALAGLRINENLQDWLDQFEHLELLHAIRQGASPRVTQAPLPPSPPPDTRRSMPSAPAGRLREIPDLSGIRAKFVRGSTLSGEEAALVMRILEDWETRVSRNA